MESFGPELYWLVPSLAVHFSLSGFTMLLVLLRPWCVSSCDAAAQLAGRFGEWNRGSEKHFDSAPQTPCAFCEVYRVVLVYAAVPGAYRVYDGGGTRSSAVPRFTAPPSIYPVCPRLGAEGVSAQKHNPVQ